MTQSTTPKTNSHKDRPEKTGVARTGPRKSDRFIPWYFVGFFALLFMFDGVFVYLATSTHTGVVTEQAYQKGIDYNETIAAADARDALGWQSEITYSTDGQLNFSVQDAADGIISGAKVVAEMTRPTHNGVDFDQPLQETAPGVYQAPIKFPLDGVWDVRIYVTWQQKQFQTAQRIIVPQK